MNDEDFKEQVLTHMGTMVERTRDLPKMRLTLAMIKGGMLVIAAMLPVTAGVVVAMLKT